MFTMVIIVDGFLAHYFFYSSTAKLLKKTFKTYKFKLQSEHLRRFKVTWELLNKHLFHSIAHNDPAISNSGPTILEHLRLVEHSYIYMCASYKKIAYTM